MFKQGPRTKEAERLYRELRRSELAQRQSGGNIFHSSQMSGRLPLALMRIDPRALRNLCAKFHLLEVCRRGRHGPSFLLDIKYALPMESALINSPEKYWHYQVT